MQLFGDRRFERLAAISNGHLYNLRHSTSYQRRRGTMPAPTRAVHIAIGERRRPQPFGQPGYLRVDSVHQGDLDGIKGLYHLNLVDEVTQFQFVGSVERIDTPCLAPVLEALLRAFPFNVRGFHTDNGSEFINHKIVARLQALHIDEFTKSRPRRSNDNALVESKNGSVIRKHLGYGHIPSRYAERVNAFTQQVLSPYLNFHRPCLFPVDEVDAKGRVRKRYPHANVMTPYEKLKSLPNAAACLEHDVRQQRRQRPSLRSAFLRDTDQPPLQDPGRQERPHQPEHAVVTHPRGKPSHQEVVIHSVEEFLEVEVHDPTVTAGQVRLRCRHCMVGGPARPETVAVVGEGRVEHRLQHLEHRLLDEPVEHRGNAQLAHAPAGFRNLDAFHR